MLNTTELATLKTIALFLSRATKHSKIKNSINASNFMSPSSNFTTEINDDLVELAIYTLFDDVNNFYVFIPGVTLGRNALMFYLYTLPQGLVLDRIECSLVVASLVDKHLSELHPKLMQDIKQHNLKTINFAGHGFGGAMCCPVFVLIYTLLIDFYKNHYSCTKDACCCANQPIHPKITCEFLRNFVRQFYLYNYKQGDLGMWNHGGTINSYNKDLCLNDNYYAIDNKNQSINETINDMMKCDKELLEEIVIEKIYTFGAPGTLSKEWADIYNTYFYNPDDIENSKHLSFQSEDDLFAGFDAEDGAYYFSAQFHKFLATFRTNKRSPIGAMVKIHNKSKVSVIDIYGYYCQNISFIDHFEFHPIQTVLINKMNGWCVVRELFTDNIVTAASFMFAIICLEIPYIIFMPILLIAKCFGAKTFLHIYQIVLSIATWVGVGVLVMKYCVVI